MRDTNLVSGKSTPSENNTIGGQPTLGIEVFPMGSRVRVINYSPLHGLRGTILTIHMIAAPLAEPFCFYLIALEGVQLQEPMWFEYYEVELVGPPRSGSRNEFT